MSTLMTNALIRSVYSQLIGGHRGVDGSLQTRLTYYAIFNCRQVVLNLQISLLHENICKCFLNVLLFKYAGRISWIDVRGEDDLFCKENLWYCVKMSSYFLYYAPPGIMSCLFCFYLFTFCPI